MSQLAAMHSLGDWDWYIAFNPEWNQWYLIGALWSIAVREGFVLGASGKD